jgi:hypothetical protein
MIRLCTAVLALMIAADAPLSIELEVTHKAPLAGQLEDLVTFGLLKEMTCDSQGHIFSPSNRKYGDAISAIVRFTHDGTSYQTFSIDELKHLEDGTITDFALERDGEIYVLARQVLKYSPDTVPLEFGENFIVLYDAGGRVRSQVLLQMDTTDFSPTGLAVLKNHQYLVVGKRTANGNTFIIVQTFRLDGSRIAKIELSHEGTKTSNTGLARGTRVFNPTAIKANGFVYVLRGTTNEPVYVLSEAGLPLRTITLQPAGLEFASPKIAGNDLIVQALTPVPAEPDSGIHIRSGPERESFPVFSLETGEISVEYFWHQEYLGLACYAPGSLTFIGQDSATHMSSWAIFEAKPASTSQRKRTAAHVTSPFRLGNLPELR